MHGVPGRIVVTSAPPEGTAQLRAGHILCARLRPPPLSLFVFCFFYRLSVLVPVFWFTVVFIEAVQEIIGKCVGKGFICINYYLIFFFQWTNSIHF